MLGTPEQLAQDPTNPPADALQYSHTHQSPMTNLELASDPNTTPEILESLVTDDNYSVRCGVSRHPNTTLEILKVLATDDDYGVRYWVAKHPNTTPEILKTLATDDYYWIRYRAAHNPNATELVRRLYLMTEAKVS